MFGCINDRDNDLFRAGIDGKRQEITCLWLMEKQVMPRF